MDGWQGDCGRSRLPNRERSKWAIGGYRWKGMCSRAIHRVERTDPQRAHNYFPSVSLDRLGWWMEMGEGSAVSPTQDVTCCGQCNACKRGCSWAEHARNERHPDSPTAQRASRAGRGTQAQSLAEMVDGHKEARKGVVTPRRRQPCARLVGAAWTKAERSRTYGG